MAGDKRYAKTMIRGICSHYPDYAMIVIDAKVGVTSVTIEHFNLAFEQNVPLIIVITKIDTVSKSQLFDVE